MTGVPRDDLFPGADRYQPPDKQSDDEDELTPAERREQDRLDRDDWETHKDR
jgi:hypothetical protein